MFRVQGFGVISFREKRTPDKRLAKRPSRSSMVVWEGIVSSLVMPISHIITPTIFMTFQIGLEPYVEFLTLAIWAIV